MTVLLLLLAALLLAAPTALAWCAYRAGIRARLAAESNLAELRALRIQASNTLELLIGAGFKRPKQPHWEDDWRKTELRDSAPPEPSACRRR